MALKCSDRSMQIKGSRVRNLKGTGVRAKANGKASIRQTVVVERLELGFRLGPRPW